MSVRGLAEPMMWWVALCATYVALISTISLTEVVVGAVAAAGGAAVAVATRRVLLAPDSDERYRPRARWLRWALVVPPQILLDCGQLLRPRLEGRFARMELPDEGGPAALRGFAALAVSTAPGTYVSQVDPDRNAFTVHRVAGRPSRLERVVSGG